MSKKNPATQPRSSAPNRRADNQVSRPNGKFRFSDRFLKVVTTALITVMLVSIAAGFILGPLSDNVDGRAGDVLGNVAVALIIGGLVLPLLLAAVLGGEAIRAGAGFVGFFLIAGMLAAAVGTTEAGQELLGPVWGPWAVWGGGALMVLAVGGFWIVGWIARVPMWIQAPVAGSPRVYVRGSSKNPADRVLPNDLE
ncbi:hypothetical protein QK292_15090 [Arthrobacter sp. AL08]|uniref:hypothetical protein n=1 Tax=Micrococcaceae TaxID=1268 RepID=UPI001CFFE6FD|nr:MULTISPECIES: hypothetical protein [Micrococcaceae]MCB5282520.1 hypothetical protein [Arthrobacter sp. ES1]MDI3242847.1 hypothetical protein [Arthrobacter sp. AL05]MDI3278890.1 hypothetical protein [Arthrobacter sp. AL08]MDJ0351617.1 hypothetical protein [Pseudarthrobacter sp. PH31-O2]WGZ81242.1 hypothetical protein QI450_08810 [Arthrobacter sp. EM1]